MNQKIYHVLIWITLVALLLGACRPAPTPAPAPAGPTPQETAAPTQVAPMQAAPTDTHASPADTPTTSGPPPTPTLVDSNLEVLDDGAPLAPRVLAQAPQGGEELPTDGAVQVVFDQPMDAGKTAAALKVTGPDGEEIQGQASWPDARTLRFLPARRLAGGSLYQASLDSGATSAQGVAMADSYAFQFITTGDLQVSQVFPVNGALDVASDAAITVIFNRPVVPLVISEERTGLPDPLDISPAVPGKGEWVNTSVYAFHPDRNLPGGISFSVKVKAGLVDATGESSLAQDYTWKFSTARPGIDWFALSNGRTNPQDGLTDVLLDEYFSIRFLQPMDRPSTEAAFSFASRSGEKVPVETEWKADSTLWVITPTQRLAIGTSYTLQLETSAQSASGGKLGQGLNWGFQTVPPPAILFTNPGNNSQAGEYFTPEFRIKFASPMRIDTVKERITIQPAPQGTPQWYYNEWDWSLTGYFLQPSLNYEIHLKPGMEDIYGNKIQKETVVRFTTGSLGPSASLLMPYDTPVLRADGPVKAQEFYVSYTNIRSLDMELYQVEPDQFMKFMTGQASSYNYQPPDSALVWQLKETSVAGANRRIVKSFRPVTAGGKRLPPGFYFLGIDTPEIKHDNPYDDFRLLIVANANLTFKTSTTDSLVWLTRLEDGQPIANTQVTLYDDKNQPIGQGQTDRDGMFYTDLPAPPDTYTTRFAVVNDGTTFAFASSGWGSGVSLWDYGIWSNYYAPANQPTAYVYTERPIYRPGQPVYFKGVVRVDDDLDYKLPDASQATVRISNYKEKVYEEDLVLSPFGSFSGQLTLDAQAALGYYTIEVYLKDRPDQIGSLTFNVAEYRKPEFQVQVEASPQNVLAGDPFTAQVQATYYSGGGVADAQVNWTLTSAPFYFTPPEDYSAYSFADLDEDRFFDYGMDEGYGSEVIAEGQGRTGADGQFSARLPADLSDTDGSRTLTFEATLTDLAMTAVSGRATLVAHRSMTYPGIRPQSYVGKEGEEQVFEIVALDWNGAPLPGQELSAEIVERRWYSVQEQDASGRVEWKTSVEEVPVTSFDELTANDKGEAEVRFTPAKGGVYRARVTALDERGNPGRASAYMWVAGKDYVSWQQTNDRSFELVTDKRSYVPGEKAQVLIASPFKGEAYALVTVERGRIRHQEVLRLANNSTVYELPITNDLAPNAYVSVLVVKGVDPNNPWPDFKMGIREIKVNTSQQTLAVQVTPDRASAGPGEMVQYTVRTLDAQDQPVSAEVSLSLSDLATLSLLPPNSQPILDYFYSERTLGVWTAMPMVQSIDEYNENIQDEVQQGTGMGAGGGKGEGDLGVVEVRQEFPDTAFWDPQVVTDENGQATVAVTLPDNLTTWRMDARAATLDTRVGQTTNDIVSTLPLLVRPQTPRFFVAEDQATLGTAVHNNTGQAMAVDVSIEAKGLEVLSPLTQTVNIPAGGKAYVTWNTQVYGEARRVDLVFRAAAADGKFKDASRPPQGTLDNQGIPVYRYEVPETVGTSGQMTGGGTRVEGISLPQTMQVTEGALTIKVSPSLAAGMTDGLTYLSHYPYECVEQTISRFLPNALSTQALKAAGLSDPELEAGLRQQVEVAVQRLANWQNPDGGWGWWGDEKSDPLTSAYVVLGLVEAKEAGYFVNPEMIERGLNFLRTQVVPLTGLKAPHLVSRQAFLLYVLARAGKPDVSSSVQLYEQRQRMAIYAQAYLASTLYWIDTGAGNDASANPRLKTLLSDFTSSAIVSATGTHWEEERSDRYNWNTDTRTTAIVLSALSQIDPGNPLNANAVRWLMSNRTNGHWRGTQETAWTLMALTRWMVASGELKANYNYAVALNGERLGGGVADKDTLRQTLELKVDVKDLLKDELNRLAFAHDGGPGNLYYTAHMNLSLPVEQVKALDQGIVVSRSYYSLDDLNQPITQTRQGDLVLARLTIVAPNDLHYVVVDDALPAGLEAVDQSLSTSPQSVEVPQQYSYKDVFWRGWGWWHFNHIQYRDERVILSASYLPRGTYIYTYLARAGTPGVFRTIPTTAQEFYFPEVYGRGEGSLFTVKP